MVRFTSPSGRRVEREVVRHPGAVCILPILEPPSSGRPASLVLIRNHRFTIDRELWELPAGTLERGEDPARCAGRELEEETGYRPARVIPLGTFYTTPGMTDEVMHAFAATDLTYIGQGLEEDERIVPRVILAPEALAMIDRSELTDAKSIVTLVLAVRRGIIQDHPSASAP